MDFSAKTYNGIIALFVLNADNVLVCLFPLLSNRLVGGVRDLCMREGRQRRCVFLRLGYPFVSLLFSL